MQNKLYFLQSDFKQISIKIIVSNVIYILLYIIPYQNYDRLIYFL